MRLTDALNTTLDLQTLLARTSELVRALIPYRIFAIFLLNERTHDCACVSRSATRHRSSAPAFPSAKESSARSRLRASPFSSTTFPPPISTSAANPEVRSELAVPLIAKNRLIGVMDLESEQLDFFRPSTSMCSP
jgi:phosphoserine phosphatase RsbU/P